MIVAVDETGEFRDVPNARFGLVTLVTITDSEWIKFNDFMGKIFPQGFGEIKGTNISWENRKRILNYIGSKPHIRYLSLLYDLTSGSDEWVQWHKNTQIEKIDRALEAKKELLKQTFVKDILLFKNQIKKYSTADYAKFIMFTQLFSDWQEFFLFDYVYAAEKSDSWTYHIVIDTQNEPIKFARLLKGLLKLSHNELNNKYQTAVPKEWDNSHQFFKRHTYNNDPTRLDMGKVYEDFSIGKEQSDTCLFLPDLIGNTIYNSLRKHTDKQWLKLVKRIMQNRSIIMTRQGANAYYLVRGFDHSKTKANVNLIIQEHHNLLKTI